MLIPKDDSVRLLVFVLSHINLRALYEAYNAYCERRRRDCAEREHKAAEQNTGELAAWEPGSRLDEAERGNAHAGGSADKKKDGRPHCDIGVLLAIVLYGYMENVYSSRKLARACRQNINFMWLLQGNAPPSHGMLNAFRKHILGAAAENLFYELVKFLKQRGELAFQNCFIDGTMLEAQANRHTAVWRKNLDRYERGQHEKILAVIQAINASGDTSFSEDADTIDEAVKLARAHINEVLEGGHTGGTLCRRTLKEYRHTLRESVKKLEKYRKQREIMGKRNSYSKTDTDATFMRMKDETLKAAYNAQIAVEGEYISGAGIFANCNDGTNLKPFLERMRGMLGNAYENITADAGYESEENYAYLAENKQSAYIKPANYERMKTKQFRDDIGKRENMAYDEILDEYTCANKKKLRPAGTGVRVSRSGCESEVMIYECGDCEGCPMREKCTASKKNRRMEVSKKFLEFRAGSEANIKSDEGILLRVNRSIQVEGAFGVAKENHHFRRFLTRGKTGVSCELFLLCFGYNVNKLHRKIQDDRCGKMLHPLKQKAS